MGSIWEDLKSGVALVLKTLPYMGVRLMIYGIYAAGSIVYFLIAFLLSRVFGNAGGFVMLIMLGVYIGFYYWSRRYLLYLVKAGHTAVITELYLNGSLPEVKSQYEYGKELVKSRVKDISILFAVDALVDGILRTFSKTVVLLVDILPLPGIENVARIGMSIVNRSLTYVDEGIFSYNIMHKEKNLWQAAKEGVVFYAQSWKPLLKSAVMLWLADKVFFLVAFILWMIPCGAVAAASSADNTKFVAFLVAIVLAFLTEKAVFEPVSLATMIVTYQKSIAGQEPNPEWEAKLESASAKFRKLKDKATGAM